MSDQIEAFILVANLAQVSETSVGANHACTLLQDGAVKCWGSNDNGQLGNGEFGHSEYIISTPREVEPFLGTVVHFSICNCYSRSRPVQTLGRN